MMERRVVSDPYITTHNVETRRKTTLLGKLATQNVDGLPCAEMSIEGLTLLQVTRPAVGSMSLFCQPNFISNALVLVISSMSLPPILHPVAHTSHLLYICFCLLVPMHP